MMESLNDWQFDDLAQFGACRHPSTELWSKVVFD